MMWPSHTWVGKPGMFPAAFGERCELWIAFWGQLARFSQVKPLGTLNR